MSRFGISERVTLTRDATLTYFDSAGNEQTAAIDTPAFDYEPDTLQFRGLKLGEDDAAEVTVANYVNETTGTLLIRHEPMTLTSYSLFTLNDGSTDNQYELRIDGSGNYLWTIRAGGSQVAELDLGVNAANETRRTFQLVWDNSGSTKQFRS